MPKKRENGFEHAGRTYQSTHNAYGGNSRMGNPFEPDSKKHYSHSKAEDAQIEYEEMMHMRPGQETIIRDYPVNHEINLDGGASHGETPRSAETKTHDGTRRNPFEEEPGSEKRHKSSKSGASVGSEGASSESASKSADHASEERSRNSASYRTEEPVRRQWRGEEFRKEADSGYSSGAPGAMEGDGYSRNPFVSSDSAESSNGNVNPFEPTGQEPGHGRSKKGHYDHSSATDAQMEFEEMMRSRPGMKTDETASVSGEDLLFGDEKSTTISENPFREKGLFKDNKSKEASTEKQAVKRSRGLRVFSGVAETTGAVVAEGGKKAVRAYTDFCFGSNTELAGGIGVIRDVSRVTVGRIAASELRKIERATRLHNAKKIGKIHFSTDEVIELAQAVQGSLATANAADLAHKLGGNSVSPMTSVEMNRLFGKIFQVHKDGSTVPFKMEMITQGGLDISLKPPRSRREAEQFERAIDRIATATGNNYLRPKRSYSFNRIIRTKLMIASRNSSPAFAKLMKAGILNGESLQIQGRRVRISRISPRNIRMQMKDRFRLAGLGIRKFKGALHQSEAEAYIGYEFIGNLTRKASRTIRYAVRTSRLSLKAGIWAAKKSRLAAQKLINSQMLEGLRQSRAGQAIGKTYNSTKQSIFKVRDAKRKVIGKAKSAPGNAAKGIVARFGRTKAGRFMRDPFGASTFLKNKARLFSNSRFARGAGAFGRGTRKFGKGVGKVRGAVQAITDFPRWIAGKIISGVLMALGSVVSLLVPVIIAVIFIGLVGNIFITVYDTMLSFFDFRASDEVIRGEAIEELLKAYEADSEMYSIMQGGVGGNLNVHYVDVKDEEVYDQYKPKTNLDQPTNFAEILCCANVFFDFDLKNAGLSKVTTYCRQLYYGSHTMTTEVSTRTSEDEDGNIITLTDVDITFTTYYFNAIFSCPLVEAPTVFRGSTQASSLFALGERAYQGDPAAIAQMIEILGNIVRSANTRFRIKNSLVIAQIILESGWVHADSQGLHQANNVLGLNYGDGEGHRYEELIVPGTKWYTYQTYGKFLVSHDGGPGIDTMKTFNCIEDCVEDYCAIVANRHPECINNDDIKAYQSFLGGYTEAAVYNKYVWMIDKYKLERFDFSVNPPAATRTGAYDLPAPSGVDPNPSNANQSYTRKINLGTWRLTGYCDTEEDQGPFVGQTASGMPLVAGRTVAIPAMYEQNVMTINGTRVRLSFGTRLMVNNHIYVVEDHGGSEMDELGRPCIDIFCNTWEQEHSDYCNGEATVYLIE